MSGELPPDAPLVIEPEREPRRRRRPPPTTVRGAILHGLRRFALSLVLLCGVVVAFAALVVWVVGADSGKTLKLAFYLGGAFMAAAGALVGTGMTRRQYYVERDEREIQVSWSVVYVALGVCLLGIAVGLDAATV